MKITNNFFLLVFMLVPILLITGPALPDISITLCGIFFLFYFIILKKDYSFLKDNFFLISIFFWLTIIFVSFFAYDKSKSFQDSIIFIRLLILPTIGYFFFFNNEEKIKKTIIIIFVCVVLVSIDTLFQYYNYSSEFGFLNDILGFKSNWYGRLTGPFGDELVPGAYLSRFGLLGYLFFFFIKKIKNQSLIEIIYLGLIGFVCFASGERMSLVTYLLALSFLFIFISKKRLILFSSIMLSIILILININFHPFYNDYEIINSSHLHQGFKIQKFYECSENKLQTCNKILNLQPSFIEIIKNFSSSAYGEIYKVGWNMFKDNPLTGVGISNYQTSCLNFTKYENMMINYDCASHPHNIYIQWLSEGGLITFLSFIILLICINYFIICGKNKKYFNYISIACMIILFWPIMSTGSLIKNWNGVFTFYIISLCISLNRIKINN